MLDALLAKTFTCVPVRMLLMCADQSPGAPAGNLSSPSVPRWLEVSEAAALSFDWNSEFQRLFDRPLPTASAAAAADRDMRALRDAFLRFAESVARALVLERGVAPDRRTGPGVGGGDACVHVVGRVLFQFAGDGAAGSVFGGDAALAEKAALNEVRAASALIGCRVPRLHSTLSAVIRLYGTRGLACALCACMPPEYACVPPEYACMPPDMHMRVCTRVHLCLHAFAHLQLWIDRMRASPAPATCACTGHCVVATAAAPLSRDSLAYGSDDGAAHVHDSSPQLRLLAAQVGAFLCMYMCSTLLLAARCMFGSPQYGCVSSCMMIGSPQNVFHTG